MMRCVDARQISNLSMAMGFLPIFRFMFHLFHAWVGLSVVAPLKVIDETQINQTEWKCHSHSNK